MSYASRDGAQSPEYNNGNCVPRDWRRGTVLLQVASTCSPVEYDNRMEMLECPV